MKKILLASVALAGLTAAASAADLPRRAAPPPVFTPVPVFTWTGFYAGFNAGYGFGTQDDRAPTVIGVPAASGLFTNAASGNTGVLGLMPLSDPSQVFGPTVNRITDIAKHLVFDPASLGTDLHKAIPLANYLHAGDLGNLIGAAD